LDNFKGNSKISTWIYRVAVNKSLSFNNKSFRYAKLTIYQDEKHLNSLFDEDELRLKHQEENNIEQLQVELNLLSIIDKTLISLLIEGLSTREIADIIGLTESNIRVKIHRIKNQLKTKLEHNQKFEYITTTEQISR
jgi:RNA polymerase sigma-70 factor (ECF subfamily)